MSLFRSLLCAVPLFLSVPVSASICSIPPHNVDIISVDQPATCVLSKLYQAEHFCLFDTASTVEITSAFTVIPVANASFGMAFDSFANFNMEFSVTCVQNDSKFAKSPKVIFLIGANSPGDPQIETINLYGAEGSWGPAGSGQHFHVSFANATEPDIVKQ